MENPESEFDTPDNFTWNLETLQLLYALEQSLTGGNGSEIDVPNPSLPLPTSMGENVTTTPSPSPEQVSETQHALPKAAPEKHGPGWPKGSKNCPKGVTAKVASSRRSDEGVKNIKRGCGRPRKETTVGPSASTMKGPLGQPRKDSEPVTVKLGKFTLPGSTHRGNPSAPVGFQTEGDIALQVRYLDSVTQPASDRPINHHTSHSRPATVAMPGPAGNSSQDAHRGSIQDSFGTTGSTLYFDEDPNRPISEEPADGDEDAKEDEYERLLVDGVGQDFEDVEGDEDSENDRWDGMASTSHCPLLPHVKASFDEKIIESQNCLDGLPPLYRNHQAFWFPRPSTFFILLKSSLKLSDLFNPRFFLWDPLPLCPDGIQCPNCREQLRCHCEINRPRRCIDQDEVFYLIGYRYACPQCSKNSTTGTTVTFRSWDPRIISVLLRALAAEFPAILSHRSAILTKTFSMLRACIQNGMGTKQYSDALRVLHLERHDTLHLQYLHTIASRLTRTTQTLDQMWGNRDERSETRKFIPFPDFDDNSENGPAGFIPSAAWLRNMYDRYIESHKDELNQHMSMLSACICGIDHSHKAPKHIARVDGVRIFIGLLTITNEWAEIRACNLVATKAHEQFRLALERMRESLEVYGHKQPELFFTDNMADKQFLEESFPSLREGVTPIEKYAHLEPFIIPWSPAVQVFVKQSATAIDLTARTILDALPNENSETGGGLIVIGFDTEWNVEAQQYRGVVRENRTAVIQIAYENIIYILQVGPLLAVKQLPQQLKLLLMNPNVIKAGCRIKNDLQNLQTASGSQEAFVGGLELPQFAKECNVVMSARCGLSDLCASVLNKRLDKNVPERMSNEWENENLSEGHINYAARDAYASLVIYHALNAIPAPQPLPHDLSPNIPVILYHPDHGQLIAHGIISSRFSDSQFLFRAPVISLYRKALRDMGELPFDIVTARSWLRLISEPSQNTTSGAQPSAQPSSQNSLQQSNSGSAALSPHEVSEVLYDQDQGLESLVDELESGSSSRSDATVDLEGYERDSDSATQGAEILGEVPSHWPSEIWSRVLKDILHIFHMFYISRGHGLRSAFARALRDAFFVHDKHDIQCINTWGATQNPPVTFKTLKISSPSFIQRHCQRIVPPPELLYTVVREVFDTYGPLKDAKTGQPLFGDANWQAARNILTLIQNGYVSDPPGVSLYAQIGVDIKMVVFLSTDACEGQMQSRVVSTHSSDPDFQLQGRQSVMSMLVYLTLFYDIISCIWLTNEIQEMLILLDEFVPDQDLASSLNQRVNGNLYVRTKEVAGILPIPERDRNGPQGFLASMQMTHKPVLPVHSAAERGLFHDLLKDHPTFNNATTGPDWKKAVVVWNRCANQCSEISYKLVEHLTAYFAEWSKNLNVWESLSLTVGP
ncbi:hypothetical protein NP233_g11480 [Leucocoprinus birnbaumii]|uniref:3'-5' exonuclease n=1 Tax=Leucocoprinus birnbaumii TaxID=56174 RepID=A0AAD5VIE1_9AGAR|nr:hypothetical protein NP233_g11480 [Leucocoprinus birnbaumii]